MAGKVKKKTKLTNLARNKLVEEGNHGSGKADPTKKKSATQTLGKKLYQMG